MSFHTGLTVVAVLLAGCSSGDVSRLTITPHVAKGPAPGAGTCAANRPCELTGTITLEHRSGENSWAALSQAGACAPLLLPASTYANWRRWNGKQVRVRGTALTRGPDLPEVLLLQYRDRWLSPSICSESALAVYVDEMVRADR